MEFENIAEYRALTLQDFENALLELFANTDSVDYSEWNDIAKQMRDDQLSRKFIRRCKRND